MTDRIDIETLEFEVQGIRLHVRAAGPADGPVVVLLHGFPEFWMGWKKQIQPLARLGYRVIVPDQRGYGASSKPGAVSDYRIDRLAGDIIGLLDRLGAQQAFIAGHDWGAAVTWWLLTYYPERFKAAAILNVPHPKVMQRTLLSSPSQLLKSWYMFFFQLPWLPEWIVSRQDWSFAARSLVGSSRKGTFNRADLEEYKKAWSQPSAMRSMIHWYRAALRHPRPEREPASWKISVPVRLIWGEEDRFLSKSMAGPSLEYCERGDLVSLPGVSHWVQHEEPERVVELLAEWFGEGVSPVSRVQRS
jgi:pimeloyl-ACP methyl ester carboxylesterase